MPTVTKEGLSLTVDRVHNFCIEEKIMSKREYAFDDKFVYTSEEKEAIDMIEDIEANGGLQKARQRLVDANDKEAISKLESHIKTYDAVLQRAIDGLTS